MVAKNRIASGLRVVGKHGALVANSSGGKRRVREEAFGTVIRAVGKGQWEVRFDFDGRRKVVRNTTLKVVNNDAGIPLEELAEKAIETETATATTQQTDETNTSNASTSGGIPHVMVSNCFFVFRFKF